ncbi:GTPase ObgE [candidate division WWE3 bacterium]|nr:GTPase ObgE [candidate division WWE3 bacterium]
MNKNLFIDTAKITIKAGNGGDGSVSFRREKFVPKGGPDGGDGGYGGSVYFEAISNMATLMDFRAKSKYAAQPGQGGTGKKMYGLHGEDLIIKVPRGTMIYQVTKTDTTGVLSEVLVADMVSEGERVLLAQGGRGGKGNEKFKSSTNQTPLQYTKGTPGEEKDLRLEIKLIADVGLVGKPNAGKSTLLNRLTGTNAKVANYPFTTLIPNLGVCLLKSGKTLIIADVPGLIEGAAEGRGLGDDFLRHVERTKLIVHLVDPFVFDKDKDFAEQAVESYDAIRNELSLYSDKIAKKREIVVITKLDIFEVKEKFEDIKKAFKKKKIDVQGISAVTGEGISEFLQKLMVEFSKITSADLDVPQITTKVYGITDLPNRRLVFNDNVAEYDHLWE